jgi:hypothetical protein
MKARKKRLTGAQGDDMSTVNQRPISFSSSKSLLVSVHSEKMDGEQYQANNYGNDRHPQ